MSNPYDEALLEIKNLKAEIQQWKTSSLLTPIDMLALFNLRSENERLQRKVERLTKAGDELYDAWIGYHGEQILDNYSHGTGEICRAWNAAKEEEAR